MAQLSLLLSTFRFMAFVTVMTMVMATATRMKREDWDDVADQAYNGCDQHDLSIDLLRVDYSVYSLNEKVDDDAPD
jgi:hypothetical protein